MNRAQQGLHKSGEPTTDNAFKRLELPPISSLFVVYSRGIHWHSHNWSSRATQFGLIAGSFVGITPQFPLPKKWGMICVWTMLECQLPVATPVNIVRAILVLLCDWVCSLYLEQCFLWSGCFTYLIWLQMLLGRLWSLACVFLILTT